LSIKLGTYCGGQIREKRVGRRRGERHETRIQSESDKKARKGGQKASRENEKREKNEKESRKKKQEAEIKRGG
jgi:hypothetical protein